MHTSSTGAAVLIEFSALMLLVDCRLSDASYRFVSVLGSREIMDALFFVALVLPRPRSEFTPNRSEG